MIISREVSNKFCYGLRLKSVFNVLVLWSGAFPLHGCLFVLLTRCSAFSNTPVLGYFVNLAMAEVV